MVESIYPNAGERRRVLSRSFAAAIGMLVLLSGASPVSANDDVQCAQSFLAFKGYDPGPADGVLGRRTTAAALSFAENAGSSLPPLDASSAPQWCATAKKDPDFAARQSFSFDGKGILPSDVVFRAFQTPMSARTKACGQSTSSISTIESVTAITRISGFNSRMDNIAQVANASEAERFVGTFTSLATQAFVTDNSDLKSRLVRLLAKWAAAGAFTKTESCVTRNGNLITSGRCTEWQRSDGQDKSAMKDATHSTFLMAGLIRTYLAMLFSHETAALETEHAAVNRWIRNGFAPRLKRPTSVYFGLNMGWYWPSINVEFAADRQMQGRAKLSKLQNGIDQQMHSDGSITDRTTRGDRALWYHYTSVGEIVMSLEMMRAAGVPIRSSVEEKLHRAVALFLRTLDDHSVIHPWAQKQRNSSYKNGRQDWKDFTLTGGDFGGSWLHIYPYRYPIHPNSAALRKRVPWTAKTATTDIDYGVGAGCIYNLAAGRVQ